MKGGLWAEITASPFICENAFKKQASLDFDSFFIALRFSHFSFTVLIFVSFD
jgi:hypothetical protein